MVGVVLVVRRKKKLELKLTRGDIEMKKPQGGREGGKE